MSTPEEKIVRQLEELTVAVKMSPSDPTKVDRVYNVCNADDQDHVAQLASQLPGLRVFSANHCNHFSAAAAEAIGRMRDLEVLDLGQSSITGPDFRHFTELRQLQSLNSRFGAALSQGTQHLKELPNLADLDLSSSDLEDDALRHLAESQQLESLRVNCTQLTGVGFAQFSPDSKLSRLSINGCPLTRAGLDAIVSLPQLTSLAFSAEEPASKLDLQGMAWPRLETLDVMQISVSDAVLREISEIKTLTWLRFMDTDLANVDLSLLNRLTNLTDLYLSNAGVTAEMVNQLTKLSRLEGLHVDGNGITRRELARLKAVLKRCNIYCG